MDHNLPIGGCHGGGPVRSKTEDRRGHEATRTLYRALEYVARNSRRGFQKHRNHETKNVISRESREISRPYLEV